MQSTRTTRRRWGREDTIAALTAVALLALVFVVLELPRWRQPAPEPTLDAFLASRDPEPYMFAVVPTSDAADAPKVLLVAWWGSPPTPNMSGGPAFVYDEAGALVDSTEDAGADHAFQRRWLDDVPRGSYRPLGDVVRHARAVALLADLAAPSETAPSGAASTP